MATTPTANATVVTKNGGTIVDGSSNVWTLYNGQIEVNGVIDPTTANVMELAYINGRVWQENIGDLWWGKTSPVGAWLPGAGTPVSPLLVSALPVSANDTVAIHPGQTITDANGNIWSINAGGQVVTNGAADPTTANVIALAYVNGKLWQENSSSLWWAKSVPADTWSPGPGTPVSPLPASATPVSANNTVVNEFSGQTITDANHNVWSINSSSGKVIVNGVPDPTTANVIAIAYEKGLIWQENASQLWWAKSSPGGAWLPANGTSTSPVPTHTWLGGSDNAASNPGNWSPHGAPQPGDTLQVSGIATINAVGNDLAGATLNVGSLTDSATATNVTINASHNAQLDLSVQFSGLIPSRLNIDTLQDQQAVNRLNFAIPPGVSSSRQLGITLNVADTATVNASALHGALTANGGTIQFIGNSSLNGSAIFNDNLTGHATIGLNGGQGEGAVAEINGSVGQDLTFNLGGVAELKIDHPDQFAGAINISTGIPLEQVTFAGLTATSGELLDGVLKLYNGTQLVDSTQVTGSTSTLSLNQTTVGVVLSQNAIPTNGNILLTHLS
jgi:hypothetical protein